MFQVLAAIKGVQNATTGRMRWHNEEEEEDCGIEAAAPGESKYENRTGHAVN
jgi:hypothetical protein